MATYQAPIDLFRRQIESIRAQTHRNWTCVISDDCSTPDRVEAMKDVLAGDPRFVLTRSPRRLGFYMNFERALSLVPPQADFVALSDQDDYWQQDKLETLVAQIGDAQLVYSDARVVDRDGEVMSDTYWVTRRNNHRKLPSLLVTNSVTGGASLFRRELLDYALPFPPAQFAHYHDHWIALVALAVGDIEFVPRPLYDYVQHGDATLGHAVANRMPGLRSRWRSLVKDPHERVVQWRHHYFVDVCRLTVWATIVRLRCGKLMAASKRRELDRFIAIDDSLPALAGMWRRGAQELLGLRSETLGAEWMLAYAFTWRRLLSASVRERPVKRLRLDAVPPSELTVMPGERWVESEQVRAVAAKVARLALDVTDHAPPRVNLLIPTIDLQHLFGGYIGKFNLAARLADHGERVRIVTVDPVGVLPPDYKQRVERYAGLTGCSTRSRSRSDVKRSRCSATPLTASSRRRGGPRTSPRRRGGHRPRALRLSDPGVRAVHVPDGKLRRARARVLRLPPLRAVLHRVAARVLPPPSDRGVRRRVRRGRVGGVPERDHGRPGADGEQLRARHTRRLLLYARPEPHASRNMFELAVLAFQRPCRTGTFATGS